MKPWSVLLLALALSTAAALAPAWAEPRPHLPAPDRVYMPLASRHAMPPEAFGHDRWEEVNPGLVLSWENRGPGRAVDLGVGVIRNSLGIVSPTISIGVSGALTDKFDVGVTGSLVYYGAEGDLASGHVGGGVMFVPALQARFGAGFVQLIPTPEGAVGLAGLTFPIGR